MKDSGTHSATNDTGSNVDDLRFGISSKPPAFTAILLGVQHFLTMVGGTIAVPIALSSALGMPDSIIPRFVGTFFVVAGIGTLAQTTIGNRYPLVQGASFSMLGPALAIIGVISAQTNSAVTWQVALLQIQGAVITAGIIEIIIGWLGIVSRLRRVLSPIVVAPTIMLIGFTLFDAPQITTTNQNWFLVTLTVGLVVLFSHFLTDRRVFGMFPILVSLLLVWVIATLFSLSGVYAPSTAGFVDLAKITTADPLHLIYPFQWGVPIFTPAFAIGMFAGVSASIIESVGDYYAVSQITGVGIPSQSKIDRGIGVEGLTNLFSGMMGTSGSTSYSENIAAIGLTGVASRYVVQVGAVVMIIIGFSGYVGMGVATIPDPIIAGLYIALFGQIVGIGISNLEHVDLQSKRNSFIIGFALFVGLAIPEYMANFESIETFRAAFGLQAGGAELIEALALRNTTLEKLVSFMTRVISDVIYIIGSTRMAIGGTTAIILDTTIDGTDVERGW